MPINALSLIPGKRIRFVGPHRPGDPEFLTTDEKGENGTECVVHKVLRNEIILLPEENPESYFRQRLESGQLFRFTTISDLRDTLTRTMREIDEEVKQFSDATKEHREAWEQRQMTPAEREEVEKRKEVAQKLMQLRQRDKKDQQK